jgi:hypothetical protein
MTKQNSTPEDERWTTLLQQLKDAATDPHAPTGINAVVVEGIRMLERKLEAERTR